MNKPYTILAVCLLSNLALAFPWPLDSDFNTEETYTIMLTYGSLNEEWGNIGPTSYNFHSGVDFAKDENEDLNIIYSVEAGDVSHIYPHDPGASEYRMVITPTGDDEGWYYKHLDGQWGQPWVEQYYVGAPIGEGYNFARMESNVDPEHLHFERSIAEPPYPPPETQNALDNPLDYLFPEATSANGLWILANSNAGRPIFFLPEYLAFNDPDNLDWEHLWPDGPDVISDTLNREQLFGEVDLLYNIYCDYDGEIGTPAPTPGNYSIPNKMKWTLSSFDESLGTWVEVFTKYVVHFDGPLGGEDTWEECKRFYFKYISSEIFGPSVPASVVCLTNCSDATTWNGVNNIQENCWATNFNLSSSGAAQLPEEALYPDGAYQIEVNSYAWDDTEHEVTTDVVVDNFIPSIEEAMVYTIDGWVPGGGFAHVIYHENWIVDSTGYSSRTAESVASGYLSGCASDKLGIAVRYSEEMDADSLGRFWVTGEWGDQTVYTSLNDRRRWLHPVEGFREGLDIDSTECWYCYETLAALNYTVTGYIGRLSLHIGDSSIPLDAVDLAGNTLDYDPSTVADPRDPVTGLFNYSSVESEPCDTGTWGAPGYRQLSAGTFRGQVFGHVFDVIPGVTGTLVGDCPYWCGFWLERDKPYINSPIIIDIVKPDESYITNTLYSGDSCGCYDRFLTAAPFEGRYGWFVWADYYYDPPPPPDTTEVYSIHFRVTVIDSRSPGGPFTYDLLTGQMFPCPDGNNWPWVPSDATIIDSLFSDGSVLIERFYNYYPDMCMHDTVFCPIPWTSDHNVILAPESSCDTREFGVSPLLEDRINLIWPNPCSESATISYCRAEPGSTEIVVYDIAGRKLKVLEELEVSSGNHDLVWDLRSSSGVQVPSGIYFIRIQSGNWTGTTRLIVAR